MKKHLIYLYLLLSFLTHAQQPCDYIPLELTGIEPIWTHLMIDTSIIGLDDGLPNSNQWSYYNGMNHLFWDHRKTFVDGNYIYTSAVIEANQDEYGFLIDKINIDTGEKIWQISVDPRSDIYSHKLLNMRISNDKFIVEGARIVEEDDVPANFSFGFFPGYYFIKEFDLETGELLHYATPVNGDTTAFTSGQRLGFNNFFYSDTLTQYVALNVSTTTGVNAVRSILDPSGLLESVNDTVIVGKYNDQAAEALKTNQSFYNKLKQGTDGSYLFIHEFIPLSTSDLPMEAILVKYDQNFVGIDSLDLKNLPFEEFKSMGIEEYTSDRILLRGCKAIGSICDPFYYVLDPDFNLINSVLAQGPHGNVGGIFHIDENDKISSLAWRFIDDGNSKIRLYHEDQTFMDTIRNFTVVESSWAASVNFYSQLENGDWLVKFTHGCWDDGVFNSLFHEVWRVSEEDFALMVSTTDAIGESKELNLSPNPAADYIRIGLEQNISGAITIYDANGKVVITSSISELNGSDIDVSQLSSGVYTLRIMSKEGVSYQRRFVKM